ncbi:transposase [Streptomyces sp. NPDC007896]|uniref:helix-turn-helix domain-containing protein n=1 Tax=Streptomyces sp. NPDC007896 TaxID=3364784 RepID=UPI0036F111BD
MAERVRVREIDDDEGRRLLRIIRRGTGSVVTWRRAQMVLLSAQGMPVAKIAEVSFTSDDRVRDVIHNFNTDGFDSLYPKYKGGRPTTFTLPERREIKKIAKSKPTEHDLPFSTWSLTKLADFLVAEGVVDDISHEGLRILLREEGVSAGSSAAQGGLFAVDGEGESGEGGFGPVISELVVVVVGEVVGGGIDEERLREVESDAEAAGVHRGLQKGSDGRCPLFVAAHQFGRASEVLGDPSVGVGAGEGVPPDHHRRTRTRPTTRRTAPPDPAGLARPASRHLAEDSQPARSDQRETAPGTEPVSTEYLKRHLLHQGVYLERIRGDRVLHEALTVGADPLHLAQVFNLSHTTASRYATIAQSLLDDQIEQAADSE